MKLIRIEIDEELLKEVDGAARSSNQSRSSFVCEALRAHLFRLEVAEKEKRDREGYARWPQDRDECELWSAAAVWPAE